MARVVRLPARRYRWARLESHWERYRNTLQRGENFVPGVGNPCADIMFIGEAPGKFENEQQTPFVGRSGALLNTMLSHIGLKRAEDTFITNLVKYQPVGNDLQTVIDDVPPAMTFMRWEIDIVNPKLVVPLGKWASGLFFQNAAITEIAGHFYIKQNRPVFPMLHPSYVLRSGIEDKYRNDFKELKKALQDIRRIR